MNRTRRKTLWKARWIWAAGRRKSPTHFAYFRKEFVLKGDSRFGRVLCAADSKYRLWVNGEYVGFGPARGHAEHPYFDTHRVRLKRGSNTLAILVQHYTERCAIFDSVQGGLICQVLLDHGIAEATDGSWRALSSDAHGAVPGWLFPEYFDARLEPDGWQRPGFDASAWPAAKVLRQSNLAPPAELLPRPIPLIREKRLQPKRLLHVSTCQPINAKRHVREKDIAESLWQAQQKEQEGRSACADVNLPCSWRNAPAVLSIGRGQAVHLIVDFGKETLASPEIAAEAPSGVIIDVGYSECLDNDCVATRWEGGRQSERIVLRKGKTRHRINQPRGFRYMILRVANVSGRSCRVALEEVVAYEALYPTTRKGSFACSDRLLGRIYDLSARTVNLCMEDAYTDCPWRERSQWIGDAQPETLFSYFCFGAYDLARKAVTEFASGNTDEGWIPGVFPTGAPMNLPTWGMRVPVIAWEYVLYSGDVCVLPQIYDGVCRQMSWLSRYETKDGLLKDLPEWCFVDWTKLDAHDGEGAVQGWYLEALEYSANLAGELGDDERVALFRSKAAKLRKSIPARYWSHKRKAFLKYRRGSERRPPRVSKDIIGQQENFLFSLLKVGSATQRRQALDTIAGVTGRYLPNLGDYQSVYRPGAQQGNTLSEDLIKIGSPFWSYYALLALMEAGRSTDALEYMRLCWGLMLEHNATSCWEMWDRQTSHCHGWSAAPAMILPAYVLGVRPLKPGFKLFEVRPHPGDITWAKGRVPTPHGIIEVNWKVAPGQATVELNVPGGTSARVSWPTPGRTGRQCTEVNGKRSPGGAPRTVGEGRQKIRFVFEG